MQMIMLDGQGGMIDAFRESEKAVAAASLTKVGRFFEISTLGFTVAAEVLDIGEASFRAAERGSSPQQLRQAIICITVKTELTTLAGAAGGAVGGAVGAAAGGMPALVAAPAGAIIFSVTADKAVDWVINRISWCKL